MCVKILIGQLQTVITSARKVCLVHNLEMRYLTVYFYFHIISTGARFRCTLDIIAQNNSVLCGKIVNGQLQTLITLARKICLVQNLNMWHLRVYLDFHILSIGVRFHRTLDIFAPSRFFLGAKIAKKGPKIVIGQLQTLITSAGKVC